MDLVTKTLAPVRRAAHQFFRCQLQLSLRGGLRVSLVEDQKAATGPSPAQQAAERQKAEIEAMLRQLRQVLDEEPETRHSLRHLAFIEQSLAREGLAALHSVPVEVLERGLDQFEELVTNWTPEGLASLRSRMAVAVYERSGDDEITQASAYRAAAPSRR